MHRTKPDTGTAHTEGPWIAAAGPSSIVGWPVVAQTGRLICTIATPPKDINRVGKAKEDYDAFMAECEANARLIASAPDMRAALIAAKTEMWLAARHQWTLADFKNWAVIQQIDAALERADGHARTADAVAKAEGRS